MALVLGVANTTLGQVGKTWDRGLTEFSSTRRLSCSTAENKLAFYKFSPITFTALWPSPARVCSSFSPLLFFFFLFTLNSSLKTRCFQTPWADVKMKCFDLQRATWWLSTIPDRKHQETDRWQREIGRRICGIKAHFSRLTFDILYYCRWKRRTCQWRSHILSLAIILAGSKWMLSFRWCCLDGGAGSGSVSMGSRSQAAESTDHYTP